ncbi:uncharacterized protein LOC117230368 isoform X1 [Bombus vosnesenskii]|uniref:Uncharacterized protein LOC117230368 isoform X1 n=1 Tax=Bombus vosnesenskii TaxID=207650 RepID=A0A6J3JU67_9HYME|nr:uncharacterized protein LOC117230368 isoform X1 [Bombus vosnesenskii]
MLKTWCKLTNTFKIKKNLWVQPLAKCSTVTKRNIKNNLVQFPKYKTKILQLVNTSKLDNLTQFISASHAETLISKRTSNGLYKSVNDVLLKTKIDVDSWNNFCTSFINHYKKQKWKNLIKPDINTTAMPATLLGIYVGPTAITWSLVDRDFNVLAWDSIIWRNKSLKYDIINSVPLFVEQLPLSSSYVMEEVRINSRLRGTSYMMQQQIISSIASCIKLIGRRTNNSDSLANILYILKPLTTARFFKLMVASEVIAVDYFMKKMLDDTKTDNELLQDIHIAYGFKKKYMKKVAVEREQMGKSLLTTLACFHIIRNCIS